MENSAAKSTWRELTAVARTDELVEAIYVVGQYTMLSMVANSCGVELEPGHDPLPAEPDPAPRR